MPDGTKPNDATPFDLSDFFAHGNTLYSPAWESRSTGNKKANSSHSWSDISPVIRRGTGRWREGRTWGWAKGRVSEGEFLRSKKAWAKHWNNLFVSFLKIFCNALIWNFKLRMELRLSYSTLKFYLIRRIFLQWQSWTRYGFELVRSHTEAKDCFHFSAEIGAMLLYNTLDYYFSLKFSYGGGLERDLASTLGEAESKWKAAFYFRAEIRTTLTYSTLNFLFICWKGDAGI